MIARLMRIAAVLVTLGCNARFFSPLRVAQVGDEGYVGAFAWRMAEGRMLPYVDAVSHRGPLVYYPPALIALVTGGGNPWPVRVCGLLFPLITVFALGRIGQRTGHELAGAIAALACALGFVVVPAWTQYHSEHVINAVTVSALALLVGERTPARLALAGALAACGFLCKPVAILLVPLLLWYARGSPFFSLGALAAPLVILARYAIAGELRTFFYFFYTYNADVYMAPFKGPLLFAELSVWAQDNVVLLGALAFVVGYVLARRRDDPLLVVLALAVASGLVAAKAPMRPFVHYYLPIVPWAALLAAILVLEQPRRHVLFAALLTVGGVTPHRELFQDPESAALCARVRAHSGEDDTIFVWGFQPWLYMDCARKPASRYVFTTFVMGFVPWFDDPPEVERARVTPGSREILRAELERERPAVIIDAPIGRRSIERDPDFAPTLDGWCVLYRDRGRTAWARPGSCPP